MTLRSRLLAALLTSALLTSALALTACAGGGESDEQRRDVIEMLERLGKGRSLAECMAQEFGGEVTVAQLQTLIDARGDFTTVDFELTEQMASAQLTCEDDD